MGATGSASTKQEFHLLHLWVPLAQRGHAGAQYILGRMYMEGKGAPRDDQKAHMWFLKAAEQDNPEAQFYLGLMYTKGRGVDRNDIKAAHWLRFAAERGNVRGQCYLSRMYARGLGVPRSYIYAYMWAMLAASGGKTAARASGAFRRGGVEKIRTYALNTLELYTRNMSTEETSAAVRMAKKWRNRQQFGSSGVVRV